MRRRVGRAARGSAPDLGAVCGDEFVRHGRVPGAQEYGTDANAVCAD
ncbi:hypothetical protein [Nocardia sp. NPDC004604]